MSETLSDDLTTVFVSYSRGDRERAIPIIRLLEMAGFAVWWDGKLEVGERYLETTEHALETAKAVVVLWSATSIGSDWVRDEAMSGRDRKCLVPVSIDGSMPPLGFRQIQTVDLSQWNQRTDAKEATEVLKIIAGLHEQAASFNLPRKSLSPRPSRRNLLFTMAAILPLVGAGWMISRRIEAPPSVEIDEFGILILPFENLSPSETFNDLASALDTEVRKTLARNPIFKVVARTSSIAIQRERISSEDIANRFGVSFVLEGDVTVTDGILQVSTSLIEAITGIVRWSSEYEGPPEAILQFQSDIAAAVIANVTNEISRVDASKRYGDATNALAFQEFLKGREVFRNADGDAGLVVAVNHFDNAISLDPGFSAAHAIKARLFVYRATLSSSVTAAAEQRMRAVESAQQAIELAPDSDDAHSTLGYVNFFARLDVRAAKQPYETSSRLGFGSAVALTRYATFASCNGEDRAAMNAILRASELDPLNPTIFGRLGFVHYLAARYDQAIAAYQRALQLRDTNFHRPSEIGLARFYAGDVEDALQSCRIEENEMERFPCEAIALRALGLLDASAAAERALISEYGEAGLYQQAQILAQAKDLEACQSVLERAYELKDTGLTMVKMDPAMAPMRETPRFKELLARIGFDQ
ncbi:MAG: TIR domain-containing protein [Pseudomonadota bacterium]